MKTLTQKILKTVPAILLGLFFLYFSILKLGSPITFESLESENEFGEPIYNEVDFNYGWDKDTWIMRQSQNGYHPQKNQWDRLAIVVDKSKEPKEATFYQLASGPLKTNSKLTPIPFKARCIACHANGPRAIRPKSFSEKTPLKIVDRIKLIALNLRIKSYGQTKNKAAKIFTQGSAFQSSHAIMNQPLGLQSCLKCHSDTGMRAPLKLEHLGTAHFMMDKGIMPPFPYKQNVEELQYLKKLMGITP